MNKAAWSIVIMMWTTGYSLAADTFSNIPAASYFNALYDSDFQRLNKLDADFVAPYRPHMNTIRGMTPLFDAIARNAGFNVDTAAALDESLDSISLIVPLLAVYLVNYESTFGSCIEPDAVHFNITTTSETVYRNGYGDFQYSIKHTDTIEHFTVNRRFERAFKEVGLTTPDSALGQMIDNMFGRDGRLNVRDITQGTRALMHQWDCKSSVVARLEKNMLAYFDQYLRKQQRVAAAMGVGDNTVSSNPSSLLNACVMHDMEKMMSYAAAEGRRYDAEEKARDEAYAQKWCNCITPKLTRVLSSSERQNAIANYADIDAQLSYVPNNPNDPAWRIVEVGNACRH